MPSYPDHEVLQVHPEHDGLQVCPSTAPETVPIEFSAHYGMERSRDDDKEVAGSEYGKPQNKRRPKVCGGRLPCWMVGVLVACALIIAGLVAGIVGGIVTADRSRQGPAPVNASSTSTTLLDASPIPSPTGLPGPPAGSWALSLGIPEEQQNGCITDSTQANAWTCSQTGPPLLFNITASPSGQQNAGTAALTDISLSSPFTYGLQPPTVHASALEWVVDPEDSNRGPALHFQAQYDKIVIVSEDDLSSSISAKLMRLLRRDSGDGYPLQSGLVRRSTVQTGDQPWVCYWNQTFIEGFIYMAQNSSEAASQSSAFASFTSTSPGSGSAVASSTTTTSSSSSAPSAPSTTSAISIISARSATSTSSAYTIIATGSSSGGTSFTVPTIVPLFPHPVKIEERRLSSYGPKAECVKMQLLSGGSLVALPGANGDRQIIEVAEVDPNANEFTGSGGNKLRRYRRLPNEAEVTYSKERLVRRDEPEDSCHCQWVNT